MKVDKISGCTFAASRAFVFKPQIFNFDEVNTFVKMEDKFIDAEIDYVRALSKKNKKLNSALKNMDIKKYDVPLLRILLTSPIYDDERIMDEIPHMLSIKWPREIDNRLCAQGRRKLAELYAVSPALNENKAFKEKIGEIISNCTTKENSEYTIKLINKYLSNKLFYGNKNLSEKLPEIIIKMQDSLYDSRIDKKGIVEEFNRCLDRYMVSDIDYGNNLGDLLLRNPIIGA